MNDIKILCILTTYKREDEVIRFLKQFDSRFNEVSKFFDIYISDDDPKSDVYRKLIKEVYSPVKISYNKNRVNLGQGINAVEAAKKNLSYTYFWLPGDDDLIVVDELIKVFRAIENDQPTVAVFEFRQGKNLDAGTFFGGDLRFETNLDKAVELLNRFGKGTSSIFRNPGSNFLEFMSEKMMDSMYQDKAMGLYALLQSYPHQNVYVHPELTATGDENYGLLRYSTRVFSNQTLTSKKVLQFFNKQNNCALNVTLTNGPSPLYWWFFGVRCSMRRNSVIRYKKEKLVKELLYGWILAIFHGLRGEFQRR